MLADTLRLFKSKLHSALNSCDQRAKIQDSDFIVGLLQAIAQAKGNFTLSDLHRSVCKFLNIKIGKSAFNERLTTASLVKMLQMALAVLISLTVDEKIKESSLLKKLGVTQIIGIDSSMVSLWDGLSAHFKGTFMTASVKLHMAINLVSGCVKWFDITPGATHDSQWFPKLLLGSLYIFDLGYWSGNQLLEISEKGAYFLSRVKTNAKLTVTEVVYGLGQSIVGSDLLSFPIYRCRKKIVEMTITMNINNIPVPFRVLGFWHKKDKHYHWYITNLSCKRSMIYDLYRLRWQIELSFKSMKSTLNFDQMPTLNQNTVTSFTLLALINYVFATLLRKEARIEALKKGHSGADSSSIQRAAKLFSNVADTILALVKLGRRITDKVIKNLTETLLPLLSDVLDPNYKSRETTFSRLKRESGEKLQ